MEIPWKVQFGIGVAVLVGGIFAFRGLLEIVAAIVGVMLITDARRRQKAE